MSVASDGNRHVISIFSAWSRCDQCDGKRYDLSNTTTAERFEEVNSRMWNRNREDKTNARTSLD